MSEIVDYRTARRHLLKAHNAANGTAHKTLAAAGLSLAVNGGAKAPAKAEAKPVNQTVARAKKVGLKIHEEVPKAKRSHHKAKS